MRILANDYEANLPGSAKLASGGPANFAKQLASALADAGHAYIGITFANRNIKRPMVNDVSSQGRIQYLRMRFPNSEYRGITKAAAYVNPQKVLAGAISAYRNIIIKKKPDIVFINGFDLRVWGLMIAAHQEGVPIIQKHAGIWHKELDIYKDFFTKPALRMMKNMEKSIPRYATKQIFLNTYCENVFRKEVAAFPKKQSEVIPLPTKFSPQKTRAKKKSGTIHIGIVARWDRIKNHNAVLELAEEIEKQGLDMKIHAVTKIPVTKNNLEFKRRYRKLIEVHPNTDSKGILTFFRSMDIAILPSHFETAGFVVLEAASQGIGTIISPYVGWVNEFKSTGNRNWIGDFTKPGSVVKKIIHLAGQPLSGELLKRFKTEHSAEQVFAKYLKLIKSVSSQK